MSRVVLDSGALIALERNDRILWSVLKLAALRSTDVLVPSTVLAQVWRGTAAQAQPAKALRYCVIASFDAVARGVGAVGPGSHRYGLPNLHCRGWRRYRLLRSPLAGALR
jgi:hypothetical protein